VLTNIPPIGHEIRSRYDRWHDARVDGVGAQGEPPLPATPGPETKHHAKGDQYPRLKDWAGLQASRLPAICRIPPRATAEHI